MNIDAMTQAERSSTLAELLRLQVGALQIDGERDTWCVPCAETFAPGEVKALVFAPQVDFAPRRLLILEPTVTVVDVETSNGVEANGASWSKKTESIRYEKQPRGIWCVRSLFIGNKMQLPTQATISGDAFGPDSTLSFTDFCPAALYITTHVENTSRVPAQFYGVIVGKADWKTPRLSPTAPHSA
jgi:hypothetical protein